MHTYDRIASAVRSEGVDTVFSLMGDGNMMWLTAYAALDGTQLVHARHESMAAQMAASYAQISGEVGVCSITYGPGLTQIATSLTGAVRHGSPLVVIVGDLPRTSVYHLQAFEQAPFVLSTGARYMPARDFATLASTLREAFYTARSESTPVVVSIPQDIQESVTGPWQYEPRWVSSPDRQVPTESKALEIADKLKDATLPLILGGYGAVVSDAESEIRNLAEVSGSLLGTTLKAHGFWASDTYNLGLIGGFSSADTKAILKEVDLIVAFGARLGHYTTGGGRLFENAFVISVDPNLPDISEGVDVVDLHFAADARETARSVRELFGVARAGARSDEMRTRILSRGREHVDFELEKGTIDPRDITVEIDRHIPDDAIITVGYGHFWHFVATRLRGRDPRKQIYTAIDFGAVGQGLGAAVGAACAAPDERVFLLDGDGGIMMNLQELETIARHKLDICVVVLNDGAYGSETQRFRAWGMSEADATFGRPNFRGVAEALGFRTAVENAHESGAEKLIAHFIREGGPSLLDVHVSRTVPSELFYHGFYLPALAERDATSRIGR